jgi:hypothetical protein
VLLSYVQAGTYAPSIRERSASLTRSLGANQRLFTHPRNISLALSRVTLNGSSAFGLICLPLTADATMAAPQNGHRPAVTPWLRSDWAPQPTHLTVSVSWSGSFSKSLAACAWKSSSWTTSGPAAISFSTPQ